MPRGGLQLGLAALGGALAALGLPSLGLWGFAWIGLVPLILAVNEAPSVRRSALCGFSAGLGFHLVSAHWIYATCRFAQVPVIVAALAVVGLASILGASWAVIAALARRLSGGVPRFARPWLWALCWTAVASFASRWTPRVGQDLFEYTQFSNLALLQAGSWGGPHLLDFVIVLFNAALAEAWLDARDKKVSAGVPPLAYALALAAGVWAHGAYILANRPEDRGPSARVEILQPKVDQYHKWDEAWLAEILAGYDELLSRPRPSPPALVVWPETAIPRWSSLAAPAPSSAWATMPTR
ncbi:MAG: hypothetical protein ABL955_16255 [Elusimicrobiota bacterium]